MPAKGVVVTVLLLAAASSLALAQRTDRPDRRDRVRAPESVPAVESYAPLTTSVFEVLSVRSSDRVAKLKGKDGKTVDVFVAEHIYDVSTLRTGDKVRVDFFQPDAADTRLRAAGLWLAQ